MKNKMKKKTIPGKVIKIVQMTLQVKWVNMDRDNKHICIAKTLKNIILNKYTYLKKKIFKGSIQHSLIPSFSVFFLEISS